MAILGVGWVWSKYTLFTWLHDFFDNKIQFKETLPNDIISVNDAHLLSKVIFELVMNGITNGNFLYSWDSFILHSINKRIQESHMTTATFQSPTTLREYFSDLSNAARAFAAALFAAQERQFVVQEIDVKPATSRRSSVREHVKLIKLANQYQDMQPNLAAELRNLASRG